MLTIAEALDTAVKHHRAGNLRAAEQLYRQVLQADPHQADALHLLGILANQLGRTDEAIDLLRQALRANPQFAEAYSSLGNALKKQGRLDEALASYRQALRLQPGYAEAHNNLGNGLREQGRLEEALASYQQALRLQPDYVEAHNNLGVALKDRGRLDEAVLRFQQALRLRPGFAAAHNNLGAALKEQGRLDEAVASFQQALRLRPDDAGGHNHLGVVLQEQGRLEEAAACFEHAVRLQPGCPEAHNNLGAARLEQRRLDEALASFRQALRLRPDHAGAYSNLGQALREQGRLDEAVAAHQQALHLRPDYAGAHNNLGIARLEQGRLDEAAASFQQALRLRPDYADAHSNLGAVLKEQGRLDEALAAHRQALRLRPDHAAAHNNLGAALKEQARLDEAVVSFQQALRSKPNYAEAHLNLAMTWLLLGDFEQGWPEYEWRWKTREGAPLPRPFQQPPWDGTPLAGRTILLHAEQGLGDTLQFSRFAPLVKERGGTVLVTCPPSLVRILGTCPGIDRLIPQDSPLPPFDVHAPLMSLPSILRTTLATVPVRVPYLFAAAERVDHWRRELGDPRAFKVGIAWQGKPTHRRDRQRSVPLAQFAPLARLAGVRLFSLQKGPGREQLPALAGPWGLTDLGGRTSDDWMETAAVVCSLDLVITVDTALAHLAGALGVPVWVALSFVPDWRWLVGRADSPWYPTMRLFRQTAPGNWDTVFADMARALVPRLAMTPAAEPITVAARPGGAQQPLRPQPDSAGAHNTRGIALAQQGRRDEALSEFEQALRLDPGYAPAHNNLGITLGEQGKPGEALAHFREALRLRPDYPEAHNNLGMALGELGKPDEAVAPCREALRLRPDYPQGHNNLGIALVAQGQLDEAVAHFREAVRLQPDYGEALVNLGLACVQQGRVDESLRCYDHALQVRPDFAQAHLSRSMALLLLGNFEEGWREYEWRWRCKAWPSPMPPFRQPLWDGGTLHGRTVLLHAEQGLGDTLQFIRFAPLVKQRGGTVVVACPPPLARLLGTCPGIDCVVPGGASLPDFDVHAPLLSLPALLGTTLATVPAAVPYLTADPQLVQHWRRELSSVQAFKVGIAWQGNPKHRGDRLRSVPLAEFAPLGRVAGVRLFSLQMGPGREQLPALAGPWDLTDLGDRTSDDWMETAAQVRCLDLVVAVDMGVAHLAGALGVPVWVALPFAPDWRWLVGREDSPWYPTLRLFRQSEPGNWEAVFARLALALEKVAASAGAHVGGKEGLSDGR
jgi:tetratricopeptide (TPR) repeat protein